jgi:hypothetical protein
MALALAGLCLDERAHFGYSNWRSACRSVGFDVAALITFTIDLMPRAALGALLGVMLVQALGAVIWRTGGAPRAICAVHAGCAIGMTAMLLLCAWLPSLPLMIAVEVLLAAGVAALLCHAGTRPSPRFSGSAASKVPA